MSSIPGLTDPLSRVRAANFLFRNHGEIDGLEFSEYQREERGFIQRLTIFHTESKMAHSVLRTKAAPTKSQFTVYDVEHLTAPHHDGILRLLAAADDHLQQYQTSGGDSFFANKELMTPFYDVRRPCALAA